MYYSKDILVILKYILLCSLLHCTVLADNIDMESEGLLPVYSIDNHKYEEGSGDIEDDKFVVTKCECSKPSTDQQSNHKNDEAVVTSIPSSVIVIIVIISLLLLVCVAVIVFLLSKIKYLNMRQSVPVPDKSADDYDSDEYSVMMDWNEPSIIVKQNKRTRGK